MAEYPAIVLTNAGLDMIAESQAGHSLIFTKMKIGDGTLGSGESISTLTALKSPKLDIPIQGLLNQGNGQVRLRYLVDNSGVPVNQGFFAREVGIYAKLGESGTERLYAYANGGNKVDWIPDRNTPIDAQIFDVYVLIGNAQNVTVVIDGSITYATVLDLTEHNADSDAHPGVFLPKAGGTMTGPLVLAADPIADMQAASKRYVDASGGINNWQPSKTVAIGDICYSKNAPSYVRLECVTAGITGATEPMWTGVGTMVIDGTATWIIDDVRDGTPVGRPVLDMIVRPGYLELEGIEYERSNYPRLWKYAVDNGLTVSEADWEKGMYGLFSAGDEADTFRTPLSAGEFWRALDTLQRQDNPVITGTTTNGSATITAISIPGGYTTAVLKVGDPISATAGIPAGSTIASIVSSTSVTMSANATATGARAITVKRTMGSAEQDAIRNITGGVDGFKGIRDGGAAYGAFAKANAGGSNDFDGSGTNSFSFDASRVVPVAAENRPHSLAYLGTIKY